MIAGVLLLSIFYFLRKNECDCKKRISYENIDINKDLNLDELFQPADRVELASIVSSWEDFDVNSDSYQVLRTVPYSLNRNLIIVEQTAEGRKHFGAIIFPTDYDEHQSYPLLVEAYGLNQMDPSVYVQHGYVKKIVDQLDNYFIVIPSFRGQALVVHKDRYCSDGFFGDAFDGATHDALRLLHLTKKEFKGVNPKRILVHGASRGGTVALLMGIRDTSINAIVTLSGPTDFFQKEVYHRYHTQFKYQFLSTKQPIQEIRANILKSSPFHFIEKFPHHILLIHGKNDTTVPVSNVQKMIDKLEGKKAFEYHLLDAGHNISDIGKIIDWVKENN